MASNPFKNSFIIGITSGLVAATLAPILLPALRRSSRPMAKVLIKGGMALYGKGREVTAHAGEMVEDVMAEIQAEQAEKQSEVPPASEWEETKPSVENDSNSHLKPVPPEERAGQAKQHGTA